MEYIIQKITNKIMEWGEFDQSIYSSIKFAIYIMTWDITVLVISCMSVYFMLGNESNMVVLTVFVIAYATLRNKAGGVHATNRKSCILLTATLFIVSMYYSMHNTLSGYINFISTIAFAMILRTGPIEQIQKRLSLLQIKKSTRLLKSYLYFWEIWGLMMQIVNIRIGQAIQMAIIFVAFLQQIQKSFGSIQYPEKRNRKYYRYIHRYLVNAVFVAVCYICTSTTQLVCNRFVYQDDIPDDIQRKFDNM